ncbi:SAP domain [Lecanosticta acicola]|uniref:SAP domain n=1 Tax=Lecanosticta acicola TaxID=111012 RepID=A0AAI8Z7M6_9PEZI|nr:SAP domain [Lecanosticta acicola]
MADYAKKKNDELATLCKDRGLPHTGKKADLVKRLEEYDTKIAASAATAKPAANEDEIDWDDEPATETAEAATNEAAANAIAAGGQGQVPNPQAVPNQEAAIDPAKTDELDVAPPAAPEPAAAEEKKEEKDFSTGLAERTLEEEIEKRRARLRKFGVPEDDEEWKKLERAQKFGSSESLGGLNKALSDAKPGRKRGRDGGAKNDGGNHGDRKRSRGRPGREQGGSGAGGRKPEKESNSNGGYPSWMTQADKDAADRRKAKFATA